ncbi:MAG: pheromone processing endoprotease [Trizodia sp. TS-e1964]|nr:MAG: pheromone processing endoprotease [Trizodia sp. TS-e1964]
MRFLLPLGFFALFNSATASTWKARNYDSHDYYALHIDPKTSPSQLAASLNLEHEGQLGELEDHHIFSATRHEGNLVDHALNELRLRRRKRDIAENTPDILDGILFSQKQKLKPRLQKRFVPAPLENRQMRPSVSDNTAMDAALVKQDNIMKTLGISDPIFHEQWHLFNPVQVGHDVNVTGVWLDGNTGHNSTVAIVDDGLDMYSDDLKENYFAEGSFDFNDKGPEPKPRLGDDRHGTRCAGEVAAAKNDVCGVGVAWNSKVAGIRILSKQISDADEAVAMNYAYQKNLIYSCSWGPPDDGQSMDAPGILIKRAMLNAVQKGRSGKGTVYVFASGNGAANDDNCNFDGYTNSIYSITIGAIDRKGLHPYYSEMCSAQLVVTYSSGSGDHIHTTDVGTNKCTSQHGGTSAAAPLAAGIFSLVLSIRPDLSWRDMQYLAMLTAVPVNEEDGEWQTTTIGKKFNHKYGYGKIDTYAIVEAAKTFKSVKPQAWFISPWMHVKKDLPQGSEGLASGFEVTKSALQGANLERLEHVTVTMNVEHGRRGDISVDLVSPNGIVSHLSTTRRNDASAAGYQDWTFMSVIHWGESGTGNWTLVVRDTVVNEFSGKFIDWKITLWGECIDPSKQGMLPMPNEDDDKDHDVIIEHPATTTSIVIATSTTSTPSGNPTDHIDRPVNEKPTSAVPAEQTPTSSATSTPTPSAGAAYDSFLPSFFPTFGVSKRTQIWIYGAFTIIVLFCAGLGLYFWLARRRRLRNNPRGDYEFEMLDGEEHEGLAITGGRRGGREKRRAGELYDAFASGDSDEELLSDDEETYVDEKDNASADDPLRDSDEALAKRISSSIPKDL